MSQEQYPLHRLGGVVMKTLTRYPTIGNIEPRQFPERFVEGLKNRTAITKFLWTK